MTTPKSLSSSLPQRTSYLNEADSPSISSDTSSLFSQWDEDSDSFKKNFGDGLGIGTSLSLGSSSSLLLDLEYLNGKPLPLPPGSNFHRRNTVRPRDRSRSRPRAEIRPIEALARSLGPDNIPQTTDLDTIPCAGIRIPSGPFSGLLAWRFVVRLRNKDKDKYKKETKEARRKGMEKPSLNFDNLSPPNQTQPRRMSVDALSLFTPPRPFLDGYHHERSKSQSEVGVLYTPFDGFGHKTYGTSKVFGSPNPSLMSLPSSANTGAYPTREAYGHRSASSLGLFSFTPSRPAPEAIVTNFILDTSSSHNTIPRETLQALGVSESFIETLARSEVDPLKAKTISLFLQNTRRPITFRLAEEGQPGRLGVQFLEEARVNVCIGEGGRGGIVWADPTPQMNVFLREAPRTVPLPKATLQSRVRTFFGLDPNPF